MTERVLPKGARMIPREAELVFRGEIYKVYQWPQKMPDGSVKTFEMLRRPDTVMVIALDQAGDVLVIDEKQPGGIIRNNHLPVGRVDPSDESVFVAAQRELREETGCIFPDSDWVLLDVVQMEKKIEWFTYLLLVTGALHRAAQHLDAGEDITVKSAPLAEVLHKDNVLRYFPWLRYVESAEDLTPRGYIKKASKIS